MNLIAAMIRMDLACPFHKGLGVVAELHTPLAYRNWPDHNSAVCPFVGHQSQEEEERSHLDHPVAYPFVEAPYWRVYHFGQDPFHKPTMVQDFFGLYKDPRRLC